MAKVGRLELKGSRMIRSVIRAIRDGNSGRRERYYLVTPSELRHIETYLKASDAEAQLYRNSAIQLGQLG